MPIGLLITGVILFAAAMLCLGAELFVPSHGVLAGLCIVLALLGILVFYAASPALGLVSGIVLLVLTPIAFTAAIRYYPRSPVGKKILLKPSLGNNARSVEAEKLGHLAGQRGVAVSLLRPSGVCDINGQRLTCVAESQVIEPGTPVEVVNVSDLRVIVKPVSISPIASEAATETT